jgi:uncharacterized protein (DUF302 family)
MFAKALVVSILVAAPIQAQEAVTYPFEGSFDDATFAVENAIISRGLTIDHVSHVGEMLNRTGADLGSTVEIFDAADVYLFCSAVISRLAMEADPLNIAQCPYGVFVTDKDGLVSVGYRKMPGDSLAPVQELLDAIAQEVSGG